MKGSCRKVTDCQTANCRPRKLGIAQVRTVADVAGLERRESSNSGGTEVVRWSGLPAAPEFRFEFQDPGHCRVGSEFPAFSRVREVHVSDDVLPGIRVMPTQLSVFPPHAQVQHGAVTLQDPVLDGSNGNGLVLSACQPVSGQSGPVGQAVLYYKPLSGWFPFRSSSKKSSSQVWLALPPVPPFPLPVTVDPETGRARHCDRVETCPGLVGSRTAYPYRYEQLGFGQRRIYRGDSRDETRPPP